MHLLARSASRFIALAGLLAACSGDPSAFADSSGTAPEPIEPYATPEESIAELEGNLNGALSEYEHQAVLDALVASGIPEHDVTFRGRVLAIEGDGLIFADDILAELDSATSTEKGRVLTTTINGPAFNGCTVALPCPLAPTIYATKNASGFATQFFRPFTQVKYYVVYPNNAPSFLLTMLNKAITLLYNAEENDCLHPDDDFDLIPITQAGYAGLSTTEKSGSYIISIALSPTGVLCGGSGRACSLFPRKANITVDGVVESRMRIGHVIAIATCHADPSNPAQCAPGQVPSGSDGLINDSGNEAVGVFLHELLHAMGMAHSEDSTASVVKDTQAATTAMSFSIMRENGRASTARWSNWASSVPSDDRLMLRKLYGGSCNYQNALRSIP